MNFHNKPSKNTLNFDTIWISLKVNLENIATWLSIGCNFLFYFLAISVPLLFTYIIFIWIFRCFLLLLLLAAILWKIKQKYDMFRRRQRLFVEMEQMASRPFSEVSQNIFLFYTSEKTYVLVCVWLNIRYIVKIH